MTPLDKKRLKSFLQDDRWSLVLTVSKEHIDSWIKESCIGETDYDTVRKTIYREGKIDGLNAFLDNIEKESFD